MSLIELKALDTNIVITDTLTKNSSPVNLSGCAVSMILRRGPYFWDISGTITDATSGTVSYQVDEQFPTFLGGYEQEWEVEFPDSSKLSFPSASSNTIFIVDGLQPIESTLPTTILNTQVFSNTYTDPNGNITPTDISGNALYFSRTDSSFWNWNITSQIWEA